MMTCGQVSIILTIIRFCMCITKSYNFKRHSTISARLPDCFGAVENVSLLACCSLCSQDSVCLAVNYQADTASCEFLNKTGYFRQYDSAERNGWTVYSNVEADTIYESCTTSNDCLENNSRCVDNSACFCQPLMEYDANERSCKYGACSQYGSSFTSYPNTSVPGYNSHTHHSTTVDSCKAYCLSLGDECQTFDYLGGTCWFSPLSLQDATLSGILGGGDYDLYQKDCDNV